MVMMIQWPVNAISLFILLFTGKANIYLYFLKLFYQLLFLVLCQDWQKEQKNSTFFPDHIWKIIILFFLSLYVLFTSQTYFLSFCLFFFLYSLQQETTLCSWKDGSSSSLTISTEVSSSLVKAMLVITLFLFLTSLNHSTCG